MTIIRLISLIRVREFDHELNEFGECLIFDIRLISLIRVRKFDHELNELSE